MSPLECDEIKLKLCTPEHYVRTHHLSEHYFCASTSQQHSHSHSFLLQRLTEPHLFCWRQKIRQITKTKKSSQQHLSTSSNAPSINALPNKMMPNRMTPINKQSPTVGCSLQSTPSDDNTLQATNHQNYDNLSTNHFPHRHEGSSGTVISSYDYKYSQSLTIPLTSPTPLSSPQSSAITENNHIAKDKTSKSMTKRKTTCNVNVCRTFCFASFEPEASIIATPSSNYSQSNRLLISTDVKHSRKEVISGSNSCGTRCSIKRSRNTIMLCVIAAWLLFSLITSLFNHSQNSIRCVSNHSLRDRHNCSTGSLVSFTFTSFTSPQSQCSSLSRTPLPFFNNILVSATRQQSHRKFHSWTSVNNHNRLSDSTTVLPVLALKRLYGSSNHHTSSGSTTTGGGDLSASDSLVSETVHSMALGEENNQNDNDYEHDDSTEVPDISQESAIDYNSYNVENTDKAFQHARDIETAPVFSSRLHIAAVQSLPVGVSQLNQCRHHYVHLKRASRRRTKQSTHKTLMDTLLEQRIIIETEQLELFLRLRPSTLRYDFAVTPDAEEDSGTVFGTTIAPPQATTPSREEREEAGEQCLNMLKEQFEQFNSKLFELSTTTFNVSCHVVAPGTQLQCALLTFDIHHFSSIFRSQKDQFCGMTSIRFNLLDNRCQLSLSIKRIDVHKKTYPSQNKWPISSKSSPSSLPTPITSSVWNLLHEVSPSYHNYNPSSNASTISSNDQHDATNCATLCHNLGSSFASTASYKNGAATEVRRRFNPFEMIVLENTHPRCLLSFDPGRQRGKNKPTLQSLMDSSSSPSSFSLPGSLSQSGPSSSSSSSLSSFLSLSDLATKKSCIELSRHVLTYNGLVIQHPTLKLVPLPLSSPLDVIEGQSIAPLDFFLKLDSKDKTSNVPYLDLVLKKYKWTASVSLLYPDIYPGILVGQTNVPVQSAHSEGPIPDFVSSAYFRFRFNDLKITKWGYRYLLKVSLKSNPACYTIETTYGPFNVRPKLSNAVVLSPNTSDVNFVTSKCHNIRMELQTSIIIDRSTPATFGHLSTPVPVSRQIDYVCDLNLEKLSSFLINFLANRAASSQSDALPFQMKTPFTANRIRKAFTVRRNFEFQHEHEPAVLIRDFVQRGRIAINGSQCLEMSLHAPSIDDLNQSINNGTGFETFNGAFVAFQRAQLKQKLINMTFIYSGELLLKIRQVFLDDTPVWEPPLAPVVTPTTSTTPKPRGRFNRKQQMPIKPFDVLPEVERNVLKRKSNNFSMSEFDEFDTELNNLGDSAASSSFSTTSTTSITKPQDDSSSTTTGEATRSVDTSTTSRSPSTRSRNARPLSSNGRQSSPKSSTSGFGLRNRPPSTPQQPSTTITKRPTTSLAPEIDPAYAGEESDVDQRETKQSEAEVESEKSFASSFFSGNKSIMWIAILFANTLLVFLFIVCFILCYYKRSSHEEAVPAKSRKPLKPFPDERRKDSNLFMLDKSDYSSNDEHSYTSALDRRQRQNGFCSEVPYLKQHAEKVQQMQRVTRRLATASGTGSTELSDHRGSSELSKPKLEASRISKPKDEHHLEEGRSSSKDSGHEDDEEEMTLEDMLSSDKHQSKVGDSDVEDEPENGEEEADLNGRELISNRLPSHATGEDSLGKRVPEIQFNQRSLPRIIEEDVDHDYEDGDNDDNGGRDSLSDQWLPNLPGFVDSEDFDSRTGSRLSQFGPDFRDDSPDLNYSLKGEDDENRKYFIYNVRDVNMVTKKECLGKITVPSDLLERNKRSKSRAGVNLTLDELRGMIRQSSDEALQKAAKGRFRYLSESYHLVATDESSTPVDLIYPTKGVFIKIDNENLYSMAKMNTSLTARLQSEYERRFGPIVPRKVPKASQRMVKWSELSQTKEQKEKAAQKEVEDESVFPTQRIRARIEAEQAEAERRLARRDKRRIAASTNFRYDSYEFQNGQAKDRTNQGRNSQNTHQNVQSRADSRNSSLSLGSSTTRTSSWVPGSGSRSPRPGRVSPKPVQVYSVGPQPYLYLDAETGTLQRSLRVGRNNRRPPWRF